MICPVGGESWIPMSDLLKRLNYQLVIHDKQGEEKIESSTKKRKEEPNGANVALNVLAVFCLLPCVFIVLLSLMNPSAFLDLWVFALLSVGVALILAILAKLVGNK